MKHAAIFLVVLMLLFGILAIGCSSEGQQQSISPEEGAASSKVIKIEVADWEWKPDVITVQPSEEFVLEITNTGKLPHGIWIPELGINEGVRAGKTINVNIKAPVEPMELIIRCNDPECGTVEQHVNMIATLKVAE